jgi:hypothetical protein
MALKYPDILEHNNPNYPLVDIVSLKGVTIPLGSLSETGSIPSAKRNPGIIVFVTGSQEFYGYKGQDTTDLNWDNTSNWEELGSGGGGTPATPLNSVQFNDNGSFGGDPRFVFNPTTGLAQISGSLQITSSVSSDVFIIKSGDTDIFKVQNDGVVVFASQSALPSAVEGGMVYSGSAFYVGIE